ncbi:hypothetical protein ACHAXT_008088 [Thalassiosira profunda]
MALRPINGGVLRRSLTTAGLPTAADFPSWAYDAKDYFRFEVLHESTKSLARVGRITTPHGNIDTPGFVAVGTNAALKAVDFPAADAAGQQLVFANTYHLILHPTPNVIRDAGGIHKFTGRNGPFITGSGGFQVFSLKYGSVKESLESKGLKMASSRSKSKPYWRTDVMGDKAVKVTEDHVIFKSYRDGSMVILSPETNEPAALRHATIHNLHFMNHCFAKLRRDILNGEL